MPRHRLLGLTGALFSTLVLFGCGESTPTGPLDSVLTIAAGAGTAPAAGALSFAPNQAVVASNITATNPSTMSDEPGVLVTWSYFTSSPYVLQNISVVFLVSTSEVTTINYSYTNSAGIYQWNTGPLAILSNVSVAPSGSGGRVTLTNRTLLTVLGGSAGLTVSGMLDF